MPNAAVVIIGDEILTGKFADDNGPFLIRRLAQLGTDLGRMAIIGDRVADIAREVAWCAAHHDHVLTTGGVGPTHDDRTLQGVAAAFDVPLVLRPELVALIEHFGLERSEANLRMATVPEGSLLVTSPGSSFPVVRVRNVWVFPGIPMLMQAKFEDVAHHYAGERVRGVRLYCRQGESLIAHLLSSAQAAFPTVIVGSYPRWGEADFKVMVSLDSRDAEALALAEASLRSSLDLVDPRVPRTDEDGDGSPGKPS